LPAYEKFTSKWVWLGSRDTFEESNVKVGNKTTNVNVKNLSV